MKRSILFALAALALAFLGSPAQSQSNGIAGRDLSLDSLGGLSALGRSGAFPNGLNGCAISTTSCNPGADTIPWQQAMDPDHPFIATILVRELNGRMEQISNRSFIKHGFFSTNSNAGCFTCQNPGTPALLGKGCSDTYSTGNNGDNFWLGPAPEIDPWLGLWNPTCSYFDTGAPPVAPPNDCDGLRSLSTGQASALGPVGNRVQVLDADFNVAGATFYYQGHYITQGEFESARGNNLGSRRFNAAWNGAKWNLTGVTDSMVLGSVLTRWTGATVNSATNGADDGRFYVAVKVSGPVNGLYHYEYAVHNRDNQRGLGSLRLPLCANAQVLNAGMSDVDEIPGNNWSIAKVGGELVFSTASNPQGWNTIYNFWFDSDAAPAAGDAQLDQFLAGAGAPSVAISTTVPASLSNVVIGPGCSTSTVPFLRANGAATLGNAGFGLVVGNAQPLAPALLFVSVLDGNLALGGCTLYLGGVLGVDALQVGAGLTDGAGLANLALPVPADPALEGLHGNFQAFTLNPGSAFLGLGDLSDGLRVFFGTPAQACN